jgi:metallopeptidase family M12-like protein
METKGVLLACLLLATGISIAKSSAADGIDLFTEITLSGSDMPPDSLAVYDSAVDISGLAGMPAEVSVRIPREAGDVRATIQLDHMDRREGFGERDPIACFYEGDLSGCEIVPYPNYPPELFSYTWVGRGDTYDLRLTIHRGYAVGILVGPQGRFGIAWNTVKELRLDYFLVDDSFDEEGDHMGATNAAPAPIAGKTSLSATSAAILARVEPPPTSPSSIASTPQLDMLVLITEGARIQAGGNPLDCRDTAGVMAYVHQGINDVNAAFTRSQIPARVGVVTVSRLNGYTMIPSTPPQNLRNITLSTNIKAFRNVVGADVVATLFDTQANLGACGVANVQRYGCTYPNPTPGCNPGPQFSEWTYYLDTVQCSSSVDVFTHELGHVLGAEHNHANTNVPITTASYPYSYGYHVLSNTTGFETVMSQKFDLTRYPVRLLQFSNPNVHYLGQPTGLIGSPNGADAYNALTLTNLLPGTAGFRSRPDLVFADGFEDTGVCSGVTY